MEFARWSLNFATLVSKIVCTFRHALQWRHRVMVARGPSDRSCARRLCDTIATLTQHLMVRCALLPPSKRVRRRCQLKWSPSTDTTTERYLLPGRRFLTALPPPFCSQVNLLGASPRENDPTVVFLMSRFLWDLLGLWR